MSLVQRIWWVNIDDREPQVRTIHESNPTQDSLLFTDPREAMVVAEALKLRASLAQSIGRDAFRQSMMLDPGRQVQALIDDLADGMAAWARAHMESAINEWRANEAARVVETLRTGTTTPEAPDDDDTPF